MKVALSITVYECDTQIANGIPIHLLLSAEQLKALKIAATTKPAFLEYVREYKIGEQGRGHSLSLSESIALFEFFQI